ncbi:hypothetical protein C0J52_06065 [Blattella germanica]|nr:hypothetical protein C0J52_06065 [Blattella germanica]
MPRAFLITHRRYNTEVDYERRGWLVKTAHYKLLHIKHIIVIQSSPERSVSLAEPEAQQSNGESSSECNAVPTNNTADCPPELYNLTQLAEVSLAAAAGHLFQHHQPYTFFHHPEYESCGDQKLAEDGTEQTDLHECPDCGKSYSTSSNLARHRQTHRSLGDKKARRCPHCDKVYVSMPAFSMHVRTHNQGCKCPYCGKCFSRPWLLQGHIRTHTGEKPFKCSICTKAFADKSNLRAHVQTHSHTKPHVCGRCGKAFALKSYLYKHEESSCMRLHPTAVKPAQTTEFSASPSPSEVQKFNNVRRAFFIFTEWKSNKYADSKYQNYDKLIFKIPLRQWNNGSMPACYSQN